MSEPIEQQGLILEWISTKNKAIKFQGDETIFKITDKVASLDFEKYPMPKGSKVNIKRFDKTIGYIQLADKAKFIKKAAEKKDAQKITESKEETKQAETRTIVAISKNKDFIKFADNQSTWYATSNQVKELDFEKLGIKAKNTYQVVTDNSNNSDPIIISINPLVEATATLQKVDTNLITETTDVKSTFIPYKSGQSNSIERQCAYKGAIEIVVAKITKGEVIDVESEVTKYTQLGIRLIQQ